MLRTFGRSFTTWLESGPIHTPTVGLVRSLLAAATLGTLLFSPTSVLFVERGAMSGTSCQSFAAAGLFCAVPGWALPAAHLGAIGVLLLVVFGWRPSLTGLPHWYVAASFANAVRMPEGGDQVAQILTLLLLPVVLTDPRRSHWTGGSEPVLAGATSGRVASLALAKSALFAARIQIAVIYFVAATSKQRVTEWADGTAIYYYLTEPSFGLSASLRPLMMPLLTSGTGVTMLTWGAMLLETMLFVAILAPRWYRAMMLFAGLGFHFVIAVFHGIPSFSIVMSAALLLYLSPPDAPLDLRRLRRPHLA